MMCCTQKDIENQEAEQDPLLEDFTKLPISTMHGNTLPDNIRRGYTGAVEVFSSTPTGPRT